MPLLKSYLNENLIPRDRILLNEIIAHGIKTDSNLVLDPNAVVAKSNGRITKAAIESLLDRLIFPIMLNAIPDAVAASDLCSETNLQHLSTGLSTVDELLGGQGWSTGEVSEICGISGSGKTQLCLSTMSTMLIQDRSSYAIWIDTLDGGFSGQRTSDIIQTQLSQQEDFDVPKEQALEILSRIHLCACQDIFDIINAIESIRKGLEQPTVASLSSIRLIVIDSMSEVLTKLMQNDNNTGYATMMHLSRELRRIAIDFNLTVLVTTMSVPIHPEEQTPSVLATCHVKPDQSAGWRYATDSLVHLSKIPRNNRRQSVAHSLQKDVPHQVDKSKGRGYDVRSRIETLDQNSKGPMRMAEIMKSARLKIGDWCLFGLHPRSISVEYENTLPLII